ncbi:uncharacterized protein LOC123707566 isoform X4 [Pieris brassicae]|uniref:uncharacterized protein LOC123707566 isoform X4 n=1 Tax=Pieris brassicae TaxID=7116 RepID=UPI001E65F5B5|nr:uncharacterized protein LOC123707566 isoform X4 [Pieris brassicae]
MVVGENKRTANIMDGIENTGDVRLHDHRLRLKQRFDIVRKLGQGTYGKVQLGINKKTGQEVAIKTIKKCKIETEADLVRIRREVQIMSSVRHPNIVHIYEVFENSEKMILVMEYCSGGELYDYLSQKKVLEEDEARRLFRQIATAVYYCHIHKICHRDLKLENVLLDETGSAKIADFGLSNVFKETSLLATFCGSPLYASPEIVKGTPYIGPEVDCWSLGVLLYTLVYGAMPFDGSNFKRLVRQISNGDYYEPKNPSSASPLIRDMLTVDPLKRADIVYICDHPWVNVGCEASCLEIAEALAAETPVRLDLLLSLAPAAPSNTNSVVVPEQAELGGPTESCNDLTSSTSMAVEPSSSAEKRILELVAEGGEDAIKPSPTRTIVAAADNKRKLELATSGTGLQRKRERVASSASIAGAPALPEEACVPDEDSTGLQDGSRADMPQPSLKSSATITISHTPAAVESNQAPTEEIKRALNDEIKEEKPKAKRVLSKVDTAEKRNESKVEDGKPSVAATADKLTSLSISQPAPASAPVKPKKLSIGGHVGSFKEQFERRASLTTPPEVKRTVTKPVVSKIAKPKAQSEDRELNKPLDNGTVRLQQIGIEPSPSVPFEEPQTQMNRGGVKKTESEPTHHTQVDPAVLLQDARRSLQSSMAKLAEERAGEENRRRAARDIISSAIRTGKPPVPYGRSSSAGVASLASPPSTPPAAPPSASPKVFKTEAHHRVEDHRNRRLASTESTGTSEPSPSTGEPIKKSAREFIIPIAVEGKGYVTPRQRSLEPDASPSPRVHPPRLTPRRISSLVSGGESEEEDDTHMHRLRSSRLARAESVSSGEEDEEDEGFHLLTAENLFSTLLHRVRALTQRLNGEEGPGFSQHPHSLFNNLHSPFFNSPHLPRRHFITHRYTESKRSVSETREGWGSRDMQSPFESMFNKSRQTPRGSSKKGKARTGDGEDDREGDAGLDLSDLDLSSIRFSEREMRALSGLTPALSRRLQRQLLRHLPPHAARSLRRTLSLGADRSEPADDLREVPADDEHSREPPDTEIDDVPRASASQFCTLPRLRRRPRASREPASPTSPLADNDCTYKMAAPRDSSGTRPESRGATDRPLLSKYLSERATSLDDSYASDGGSLVTDPSYIAAYGSPAYGNSTGQNFRRHSLRLCGDRPKKRISRFLRSDFFESPPDESVYTKHKKEKELETQKILKEIREKRSRTADGAATTPTDVSDGQNYISEDITRKCLSPTSILIGKDRSRSNTPFFPSLDNIKENTVDSSTLLKMKNSNETRDSHIRNNNENVTNQETRIVRPKSYPAKSIKTYNTTKTESETKSSQENESEIKHITSRESKLLRPKSYPNNTNLSNKTNSNRTIRDECKSSTLNESPSPTPEAKTDVEVSFNITLPRKTKPTPTGNSSQVVTQNENLNAREDKTKIDNGSSNLVLKKYKVVNSTQREMTSAMDQNTLNESIVDNADAVRKRNYPNSIKNNNSSNGFTRDNSIPKDESKEEKKITKKKVIKKVPSKPKTTELGNDKNTNDIKSSNDKKILAKKHKEKSPEDSKQNNVTKKKSVLQSIGHKLEKLTSSKSNSPEKTCKNSSVNANKKETLKLQRTQREHSVPVEPPTESKLIKRAVTVTDVGALDNQSSTQNKTTVSKVLGLFKKFEPKEKQVKLISENALNTNIDEQNISAEIESDIEKPRRPSSLLLNGVNRKNNIYNKTGSDSFTALSTDNDEKLTKKDETKSIRSTLKLDFSKLPRVKKIVPTNPVIEPQIMDTSTDKGKGRKSETNGDCISDGIAKLDLGDTISRSRSRSRSIYSNSDVKSDHSAELKEKNLISPSSLYPIRSHDSTTPEKEDVGDRIRRKSFYSRFNEKKQRRKSNLVGPGAVEYDPVARIYSHSTDKYDASPTSPNTYDISPGYSVSSDASPSTDRYRSSLADLPRNNLRYDSLSDKVDTYRSLDRSDLRKYSGTRSYLDYDQPSSYGQNRYSRTKSLLETSDGPDSLGLSLLKEPHKYNRTNSLYAPGSYATYRPKRTQLNSAIILKESEKEPSPENILEKIRNRKYSIRVTRKSDQDQDSTSRPAGSPQGEGDSAERSEKGD